MEHVRETSIQYRGEKKFAQEEDSKLDSFKKNEDKEIEDQGCSLASPTPEKTIHPPRIRNNRYHSPLANQGKDTSEDCKDQSQNTEGDSRMTTVRHPLLLSNDSVKEKIGQLSEKYKILVELFDQMVISIRLLSLKKRLPNFHNISTQVEVLTKRKFLLGYLAQMKYLLPDAIQIEKILLHNELSLCMKSDIRVSLNMDAVKSCQKLQQASYLDLRHVFRIRLLEFLDLHPEDADIPAAPIMETSSHTNLMKSLDQLHTASPVDQALSVPTDEYPLPPSHLPSFNGYFSKKIIDHDEQMTEACSISISRIEEDTELLKDVNSRVAKPFSPVNGKPVDRTPAKVTSGPIKLMTETPAQSTPERPVGSPSVKSTRRALHYSPSKSDNKTPLEKISRRQQILASLPGTVNTIASFIGASSSSTVTKQELVHKILSYNCDLEDPCEVEEQLTLLEELVPDWIRCVIMSTGDPLYCISRSSDLHAVRARLVANQC